MELNSTMSTVATTEKAISADTLLQTFQAAIPHARVEIIDYTNYAFNRKVLGLLQLWTCSAQYDSKTQAWRGRWHEAVVDDLADGRPRFAVKHKRTANASFPTQIAALDAAAMESMARNTKPCAFANAKPIWLVRIVDDSFDGKSRADRYLEVLSMLLRTSVSSAELFSRPTMMRYAKASFAGTAVQLLPQLRSIWPGLQLMFDLRTSAEAMDLQARPDTSLRRTIRTGLNFVRSGNSLSSDQSMVAYSSVLAPPLASMTADDADVLVSSDPSHSLQPMAKAISAAEFEIQKRKEHAIRKAEFLRKQREQSALWERLNNQDHQESKVERVHAAKAVRQTSALLGSVSTASKPRSSTAKRRKAKQKQQMSRKLMQSSLAKRVKREEARVGDAAHGTKLWHRQHELLQAALAVQQAWRIRQLIRSMRHCRRAHAAATTIGRLHRGHTARVFASQLMRILSAAALAAQRLFRGMKGRIKATEWRILATTNTLHIQRVYRGHVGRKLARMQRFYAGNVVTCQRVIRGGLARQLAARLRERRYHRTVVVPSANDIQRVWRGRRIRRQLPVLRQAHRKRTVLQPAARTLQVSWAR